MRRRLSATVLAAVIVAAGALFAVAGPTVGAQADTVPAAVATRVKMIAHGYVGQDRSNWCGPATARMILAAKIGVSRTPSQAALAADNMVNDDGGTDRYEMAATLTKHLDSGSYAVQSLNDGRPLTAAQRTLMFNRIQTNVYTEFGVAINVLVKRNTPRPSWFPRAAANPEIDHWMAVLGYDTINNQIAVVDPASWGRNGLPADKDYHWIKITDIAQYTKSYVY